jgi:hypothetical protein
VKQLLLALPAVLLLTSGVQAQTCFDFDPYCDGLELSLNGTMITGYWRNTDCAGTDVAVIGEVRAGIGYVKCDADKEPCPSGETWAFVIDGLPLDGTMIMYQYNGSDWDVWLDPLYYDDYSGPCLFAGPGQGLDVSTIGISISK